MNKTTLHPVQPKTAADTHRAGIIEERDPNLFTIRLRVPGGRLTPADLTNIAAVAEAHAGLVHLTVRQSLELVNVNEPEAALAELTRAGQQPACTGARFRVPVACGGCEYNPRGLVDTQAAALALDRRFTFTETGHHKFKVAFAGCPNDCPKTFTNDLGFCGAVRPKLRLDRCNGCGRCVRACREQAILTAPGGKPAYHAERCANCGDCIKACPRGCWTAAKRGYTVSVGGKWGRQPIIGAIIAVFLPEEKVVDFAAATFDWYRDQAEGLGRIRLGELLLVVGVDSLLDRLRPRFGRWLIENAGQPRPIKMGLRDGGREAGSVRDRRGAADNRDAADNVCASDFSRDPVPAPSRDAGRRGQS